MSDELGHRFINGRCDCGADQSANYRCENYSKAIMESSAPTNKPKKYNLPLIAVPSDKPQSSSKMADAQTENKSIPEFQEKKTNIQELKSLADIQDVDAAVAEFKTQGYRIVGVAGMRGAGKTVFLTRLIDVLTRVEGLLPLPNSHSFARLKELRTNKVLERTSELAFYFYSLQRSPNSEQKPIVFIDFSGEHLATEKMGTGVGAETLSFLQHCDAYVMMCPIDDLDTYNNHNEHHNENIIQMTSSFIKSCQAEHSSDKPLVVVFSKADIYQEELNPYYPRNRDTFDVLKVAKRFPAYKAALNYFSCLRFCFISTGEWESGEDANNFVFQRMKNPDAPSYGLLDVYHFIKEDPPDGVMKTLHMIEKHANWLSFLAKVPGLGKKLKHPKISRKKNSNPDTTN
jgi:hypothetical protein